VRRDSITILFARGFASAAMAWKALLLILLLNVVLAFTLSAPFSASLHEALDRNPQHETLVRGPDSTFWSDFSRRHPDVTHGLDAWDDLLGGTGVKGRFFSLSGVAGSAVALGLLASLIAALSSGGFAGRFGADRDRSSLSAFGNDAGRFAFSSLVLFAFSIAGILGAYRFVFVATGDLYEPSDLRYEWEAIALSLLRLLAFLLLAGLIRLVVLYARASIGITRNGNPALALASGLGFLSRRIGRAMTLEILFGAVALLPLVAWAGFAPGWDGSDPARLALLVAFGQLVVLFRITARVAHLGAASAFMRRVAEAARPVPEKIEPPVTRQPVLVSDPVA
jgi:hypothetical protein